MFELRAKKTLKERIGKKIGGDLPHVFPRLLHSDMHHRRASLRHHRGKGFGRTVKQGQILITLRKRREMTACQQGQAQEARRQEERFFCFRLFSPHDSLYSILFWR